MRFSAAATAPAPPCASGRDGRVDGHRRRRCRSSVWKAALSRWRQREVAPAVYLDLAAARRRRGWARRDRRGDPRATPSPRSPSPTARSARRRGRRSAPTTTRPTASSTTSPALAKGTLLEYRAVAKDAAATSRPTSTYGIVGDAATPAAAAAVGVGPVTQPDNVSASRATTTPRWAARATGSRTAPRRSSPSTPRTRSGRARTRSRPATTTTRSRSTRAGTRTTAPGAPRAAATSPTPRPAATVTFYYDHAHALGHVDAQGPIITAPGLASRASSAAPATGAPDCMRPWLQDPDGDGTYTWSTDQIPAGSYEFKVAHGLSLGRELRRRRRQRQRCSVPVRRRPSSPSPTSWPPTQLTVKTSRAGAAPDLTKAKAHLGRPATSSPGRPSSVPAGTDPRRCHVAPALVGRRWPGRRRRGRHRRLDRHADATTRAGCRPRVVAAHPELKGYLALRLSTRRPPATPRRSCEGQVAVGDVRQRSGRLTRRHRRADAGRARRPVRRRGRTRDLRRRPGTAAARRSRLWAPTAQAGRPAGLAGRGQRRPRRSAPPRARRCAAAPTAPGPSTAAVAGGAPATCTRCRSTRRPRARSRPTW